MENIDAMTEFLNKFKADTMAKNREIAVLNDTISGQQLISDGLKRENDNKQQTIETLNGENAALKIKNEELVNDYYEKLAKLTDTKKLLRESNAVNQSNKEEIEKLNGELKSRDDTNKKLADDNEALKADKETILEEYETREKHLIDDNKRMEAEIKLMDNDLKDRMSEIRRLEQKVKNSQKTAELQNEIKSLKLKIEQLSKDYDEANEKFAQKCDELRKLHNEKTGLEIDYSQMVAERDEYKTKWAKERKNVLKLKSAADLTIADLRRSKRYYYMTNERNKRRVLAEKIHSLNHVKLVRKGPEVIDNEQEKIRLEAYHKLETGYNKYKKVIDDTFKQMKTKSKKVKKRVIQENEEDMEESRKRAKRVIVKRPNNRVQCAHCDLDFVDTGNCQKHMTMVHMVDGLARNLDDKSPIEIIMISDD